MTTSTCTTTTRMESPFLTKKEIVERLFKYGQISFDEMLTLLTEKEVPRPIDYTPPFLPDVPVWTSTPTILSTPTTGDPLPEQPTNTCSETPLK